MFTVLILAALLAAAFACVTHTIIQSYQGGATSLQGSLAITGDGELNSGPFVLAAESEDVELDVAFVRANVKALALSCTAACTVKTNTAQGVDTVELTANQPTICKSTAEVQALFPTADVTKFYLTSAAGGTLEVRILLDQTP